MKSSRRIKMKSPPENRKSFKITSSKRDKAVKKVKKDKVKNLPRRKSRRRLLDDKRAAQLKEQHKSGRLTIKQLATKYKISVATLYNYLKST